MRPAVVVVESKFHATDVHRSCQTNPSPPLRFCSPLPEAKSKRKIGSHLTVSPLSTPRHVTFSEVVKVKTALHLNDFSDDEIKASWYDMDDFDAMKRSARKVVYAIKNGMVDKLPADCCIRGLELKIDSERRRRRVANIDAAIDAVLEEQEYQFEQGVTEPASLALAYSTASLAASREAHNRGLQDRFDAQSS